MKKNCILISALCLVICAACTLDDFFETNRFDKDGYHNGDLAGTVWVDSSGNTISFTKYEVTVTGSRTDTVPIGTYRSYLYNSTVYVNTVKDPYAGGYLEVDPDNVSVANNYYPPGNTLVIIGDQHYLNGWIYNEVDGGLAVTRHYDKQENLKQENLEQENLVIPAEIMGVPVVVIGDGISFLRRGFYDRGGAYDQDRYIINIPDNVRIKTGAFFFETLEVITLGANVTLEDRCLGPFTDEYRAYYDYSGKQAGTYTRKVYSKDIYSEDDVLWYLNNKPISNGITYYFNDFFAKKSDGGLAITRYYGNRKNLVIPAEIMGIPVVGISSLSGGSSQQFASVVIPDSVTYIEPDVFSSGDLFGWNGESGTYLSGGITIGANVEIGERNFIAYEREHWGRKVYIGFTEVYNGNGKQAGTYTWTPSTFEDNWEGHWITGYIFHWFFNGVSIADITRRY